MSWNMSSSPRIHIGMVWIKSSEHWECILTKCTYPVLDMFGVYV